MSDELIVVATFPWWDEPPEMLARCVSSLAGFVDRVVALDGAYELTPGPTSKKIQSPKEQRAAIIEAAKEAGIEANVFVPTRVWEGQVAKRDYLLRLAAGQLDEKRRVDWLLNIDADYVAGGEGQQEFRRELAETQADALMIEVYMPVPETFKPQTMAAGDWHEQNAGKTDHLPLLLRALPGITMELHHWWISGIRNGQRVSLWGAETLYPRAETTYLQAEFWLEHLCLFRDEERVVRNRRYCQARAKQVEQWGAEA